MLGGKTLFSSLFRLIKGLERVVSAIESLYETSLVPERTTNGFLLQKDPRKLLLCIREQLSAILLRRKRTRFVVKSFYRRLGRPRIVHFIVRVGVIGGAARLIFDIINKLGHKYDMEIIILSDVNLEEYPYLKLQHFIRPEQTVAYLKKVMGYQHCT